MDKLEARIRPVPVTGRGRIKDEGSIPDREFARRNLRFRVRRFSLNFRGGGYKAGIEGLVNGMEPAAALQGLIKAELIQAALETARLAYAPYSGFRVGAALLLESGEMVTGANVENVSYGLTICAERSALVRAVAMYGPEVRVAAAAIVNLNDKPSPPCGACRQVLAEFMDPEAPVSFPAERSGMIAAITLPFRELLPYGFEFHLK